MKKIDRASTLVLVSRLLDYPDSELYKECSDLGEFLKKYITDERWQKELAERLKELFELSIIELQELYVETFDYQEKTGLYLTAQELGDSRRRGGALIGLQKLITDLGFETVGKELADYIPMLLELVVVAPMVDEIKQLERRLAYGLHRIQLNLPKSNPYFQVFDILMTYIFEAPNADQIAQLENERESADLDELPYPMLYG